MNERIKASLLVIAALVGTVAAGVVLPGCFDNGNVGGAQEYKGPQETGCIANGTPPGGYIRTDSIDAGNPECNGPVGSFLVGVYTQFTDYPVASTLSVCATEDLSAMAADGWTLLSLPERDTIGCDSQTNRFLSDPNYKNVVWMKRTSAATN